MGHALTPHRSGAQPPPGLAVTARVELAPANTLRFEYRLTGELARLALPRHAPSQRAARLWEHTCFEAFVAIGPGARYCRAEFLAIVANGRHTRSTIIGRACGRSRSVSPPRITGSGDAGRAACDGRAWQSRARRRTMAVARGVDGRRRGPRAAAAVTSRCGIRATSPTFTTPQGFTRVARRERSMKFGLDRLLASRRCGRPLRGKRVALLAHPASVTRDLDARARCARGAARRAPHGRVRAAARPARRQAGQHGRVAGFQGPRARHPGVQPLRRRAAADGAMMATFDVLLVDLQDVGCRIYTFITTLRYVLEEAARHGKAVWVLDRPNPVGRPIEGLAAARRAGRASSAPARCRCATGSRWASSRAGSSHAEAGRRLPRRRDGRLGARGRPGLRLAARRARVDQSEPERARCCRRRAAIPAP